MAKINFVSLDEVRDELNGDTGIDMSAYADFEIKEEWSRHGGAFDRGGADSYYMRPFEPHYYKGSSYSTDRVEMTDMTVEEIVAYTIGYNRNEASGNFKDYF